MSRVNSIQQAPAHDGMTMSGPTGSTRWERFGLIDTRPPADPITADDLRTLVERRGNGVFVGIERHPETGARMARVRCPQGHDLGLHERGQLAAGKSPFLCDECRLTEVRQHLARLDGSQAIGYAMVQHPGRSRQKFIRVVCANGHDLGLHQVPLLLRLKHGLRCQQCYDAALKVAVEARGWTLQRVERSGGSTIAHLICPVGHATTRNNCTGLLRQPYQDIRCDDCLTDEARRLVEARDGVMIARSGDGVTVACQAGHTLGTFQIGSIRQGKGPFRCEQCLLAAASQHAATLGEVTVVGRTHAGALRAVALACLQGHALPPVPIGQFMKLRQAPRCEACASSEAAQHGDRLGLRLTRDARGWRATCPQGHDAGVWTAARLATKQERYVCPTCLDAELGRLAEAKGVRIRWPRHGDKLSLECSREGHLIGSRTISNLRSARGAIRCDTCRRHQARSDVERSGGVLDRIIEGAGEWRAVVNCPSGHPIGQFTLGNLANRRRPFRCSTCVAAEMRALVERRGAVFLKLTSTDDGGRLRVLAACPHGHELPELQPGQLASGRGPLRCRECAGTPERAKWIGERGTERLIAEMEAHVDAGGDPNPPNLYVTSDEYKLGNALVRARLGTVEVTDDQWARLEALGVRRESGHRWFGERLIKELTDHIAAGGDARPGIDFVTPTGYGLGAALARARNGERSTLDDDQRERLISLGVVFGEDRSTVRALRRDARRAKARVEHDRLAAAQGLRIVGIIENPERPGSYQYMCEYAACGHPAPNRTPHALAHNTVRRCKQCPAPPKTQPSRPSRAIPAEQRRDIATELVDVMRRAVAAGASPNPRNKDRYDDQPYGRWLNEARRGTLKLTDDQWDDLERLGTARHVRGPGRLIDEMEEHVAAGGDPNPPQTYTTPDGYPLGETLFRARRGTNHVTADQWAALEALGVLRRPDRHAPSVRGQAHGNAKLNDTAVREIRIRHAAGVPVQVLADRFGVSPASISNVATRRTWSHVD